MNFSDTGTTAVATTGIIACYAFMAVGCVRLMYNYFNAKEEFSPYDDSEYEEDIRQIKKYQSSSSLPPPQSPQDSEQQEPILIIIDAVKSTLDNNSGSDDEEEESDFDFADDPPHPQ